MTNKLRSVIKEWKEKVEKELGFFYSSSDSDFYLLLTMQLDAIIEDMKEDVEIIEELLNDPNRIQNKEHYKGSMSEINVQIRKLKQAREELSTSLTQ